MAGIWFTSDLHFGHRLVAGFRGFGEDTEAHDAAVLASLAGAVAPEDTLYVLGDISCGGKRDEDRALELLRALSATKHLIAGNHDSVASIHRTGWKRHTWFNSVFLSVRDFARIRVRKQDVLLSHYPYLGEGAEHPGYGGEVRYAQYRLPDMGLPLIHGHTHIADQVLHHTVGLRIHGDGVHNLGYEGLGTPQVHVGWDAWRRPVALHEVEALIFEGQA